MSADVKHTDHCTTSTQQARLKQMYYDLQYPGCCLICQGTGFSIDWQSVPYGPTSASFEVIDPCTCVDNGRCPRCGRSDVWEWWEDYEETPCPRCGWEYERSHPRPDLPECDCWERAIEEALDSLKEMTEYWPPIDGEAGDVLFFDSI